MASLQIHLLGGFSLVHDGQAITLPGRKVQGLLAFLALPLGRGHGRERLAGLLWGEMDEEHAHGSLRQAVHVGRKLLRPVVGPDCLRLDKEMLSLCRDSISVDASEFERKVAERSRNALAEAAALYRGPLLEGIAIDNEPFLEWLLPERERFRQLALNALRKLISCQMQAREDDAAAGTTGRLLAMDPLDEDTHLKLIELHIRLGRPGEARRQYETLTACLRRELNVEPSEKVSKAFKALIANRAAAAQEPVPAIVPSEPTAVMSNSDTLVLPEKPSIAILPFTNMSGDSEQEYFADGIVEEIITALSQLRWLFVIARNSSFTYKGRHVDVKQVGRDLGVRYVLEGSVRKARSVRKAATRVRITGQLVDTSTGAHLWADRFDGMLEDIFALQDQVTASVVGAIAPKLEHAEIERAKRKPTESLGAYDYFLRGMASVHQGTREANFEALRLFYRAIELDPGFASAHGIAAWCYAWRKWDGFVGDRAKETAEAARLARRATELDNDDAVALAAGGYALAFAVHELDDGAAFIERALMLNPNLAMAWHSSGWVRVFLGEPELAIKHLAHVMRLSPLDRLIFRAHGGTAYAYFFAGRYDEACLWAEKAFRGRPTYLPAVRVAAASHALAGRLEEAQKAMAHLLPLHPALRVSNLNELLPLRRPEDSARLAEGMRKAGLPE